MRKENEKVLLEIKKIQILKVIHNIEKIMQVTD